jgi:hypothetical protein
MPQHIGQYSQIERLPGYTVDQDLTDLHSINARESLGVESIRNVEKFVNVSNVRPLTVLSDGKLYGANDTEDIYVSDDDGDSWTLVSNGLSGTIRCIRQLGDGEVLVSTSSALQKSSGWPNSPTWSSVLSVTNGIFLEWGVKTYPGSNKCAASEYDGDYLGSKVWISDDDGDTWTEVFSVAAGYHIHGVERDQWANWRIFVCYHRGPGSDPNKPNNDENGTWYSDNGGTTWNRVPFQSEYTIDADEGGTSHPDPTTIDALERGVVFGSDHPPNGIWILPRVPNTNPEWYIRPVLIHRDKSVSLSGVARKGVLGSDGILYVGFNSISPQEGYLDATDGVGAWTVYTTEEGGPSPNPAGVTSSGKLILRVGSDTVRTDEPKRSVPTIDQLGNNAGGIFGGINAEAGKGSINTAVAIGQARATGDSSSEFAGGSVAVGFGANAPGTNGVSVGPQSASGIRGVSVGGGAKSSRNGYASGWNANSVTTSSVGAYASGKDANTGGYARGTAVGNATSIRLTNGTAIGHGASADLDGTATGYSSDAERNSVANGSQAHCTGWFSVCVGASSNCPHENSVVVGYDTDSTADFQVMVGGRDVEITDSAKGLVLQSPDGTRWRVTIDNTGTLQTASL